MSKGKELDLSNLEEGMGSEPQSPKGVFGEDSVMILIQKLFAEVLGTFFIIFAGCGVVVVEVLYGKPTFPGICVTWGLICMVMVYSLGHISGGHFNPSVSLTWAVFGRFPWVQFPLYFLAQLMGSILASGVLSLIFDVTPEAFFGTTPRNSNLQSFVVEIIITFLLMFVISGVSTDSRSVGELAGIAVGMTIMLNVFVAGPISGASMNPARSLGPAIVRGNYKGIWIYLIGPPIGAISGAFAYNLVRFSDKPVRELTKSGSFLRSLDPAEKPITP